MSAIAYPMYPHHATHPEHTSALASWCGIDTPPVEGSRVLEIGCASGANLVPMAARIAGLSAVGIDCAADEIARARALSSAAGVSIRWLCADLMDLKDVGTFDYIIAHGLLSWVAPPIQDALFSLVARSLAPNGVAYLSYNVLAGSHERSALRAWLTSELVQRAIIDDHAKLTTARQLLEAPPPALAEAAARLQREEDGYLHQEYLLSHNESFPYPAFVARAAAYGLTPLCDSNGIDAALGGAWLPAARAARTDVGDDLLAIEDRLDEQSARSFRSTLVARSEDCAARKIRGPAQLFFTTALRVAGGAELTASAPTHFESRWQTRATIADGTVKRMLAAMIDAWPAAVHFSDLHIIAGPHTEPILSVLVGSNLVHPRRAARARPTRSTRPRAQPDVRAAALLGAAWAADPHHRGLRLDTLDRQLLPLLDGAHSRDSLAAHTGLAPSVIDAELDLLWSCGLTVE